VAACRARLAASAASPAQQAQSGEPRPHGPGPA